VRWIFLWRRLFNKDPAARLGERAGTLRHQFGHARGRFAARADGWPAKHLELMATGAAGKARGGPLSLICRGRIRWMGGPPEKSFTEGNLTSKPACIPAVLATPGFARLFDVCGTGAYADNCWGREAWGAKEKWERNCGRGPNAATGGPKPWGHPFRWWARVTAEGGQRSEAGGRDILKT